MQIGLIIIQSVFKPVWWLKYSLATDFVIGG
ncbi:uncharacterized protein METZ01_LOCUS459717 [marine metagenome]|uniref:Uncharacterized protein n=1 Tax=marine metagenome TaxID=408172 RepID=A0A383AGZ7_9ZZZZ